MTLHGLVSNLTETLNLTPEQQFRVTALVKRLVHNEKAELCHRLAHYCEGFPVYDRTDPKNPVPMGRKPPLDQFIYDTLKSKYEGHKEWSKKPDEEIVTWDVGSHRYVQQINPCNDCSKTLTGGKEAYVSRYDKELDGNFCKECAKKRGIWEMDDEIV